MSMEEVGKRWRGYIAELLDDEVEEVREHIEDCEGPEILQSEVQNVMKEMKRGKSSRT